MAIVLGVTPQSINLVRTAVVPTWMIGGGGGAVLPPPTTGQIWPRGEKATG